MIPRYTTAEMARLWSDEYRFTTWLRVETVVLEELAARGLVPREAAQAVAEHGRFDVARIEEIEAEVRHDVIAFVSCVAESVGEWGRFLHWGMTSSDLLDTSLAVLIGEAGAFIVSALDRVTTSIRIRAEEFRHTICVGRTHGQHGEPTTFGLKLLSWYCELRRRRRDLTAALDLVRVGKLSGAVGTYSGIPPEVERAVMERLGLKAEWVATQVVSRDRHASLFAAFGVLASSIERFVTEIRHLQRTEVWEVREPFGAGQKGSSAMPHKQNPVLSENLTGLARVIRAYVTPALENIALWHERDISHSSVERITVPDVCTALHFMLVRFDRIVANLTVDTARMQANLDSTGGLIYSGSLLTALVDGGLSREDAYRTVQGHALAAVAGGSTFRERMLLDPAVRAILSPAELDRLFKPDRYMAHVDRIFERVLGEEREL